MVINIYFHNEIIAVISEMGDIKFDITLHPGGRNTEKICVGSFAWGRLRGVAFAWGRVCVGSEAWTGGMDNVRYYCDLMRKNFG